MPDNNTTTSKIDHPKDPIKGLFRGVVIGVFGPLFTVPIDRIQSNIVVHPEIKPGITGFFKHPAIQALIKNPLKGYFFVASTNFPRATVAFVTGPMITNQLQTYHFNHRNSEILGFAVAGMLEGLVSGPVTVIKQRLYTTEIKSAYKTVQSMTPAELAARSLLASNYLIIRNGFFWPTYSKIVQITEKYLSPNKENKYYQNQLQQFLTGAGAGAIATIPSHPWDAMLKRRLFNPKVSALQLVKDSVKNNGWYNLHKFLYRGLPISLIRIPIMMGATNIGVHIADRLYASYQSRQPSTAPAVEHDKISSYSKNTLFQPKEQLPTQDATVAEENSKKNKV